MSNTITGEILVIQDKETFASGFEKQTIIIDNGAKWQNTIPIEFIKESISLLQNVRVGDNVTIDVDLQGREHNGRYFCSIKGWKIRNVEQEAPQEPPAPTEHETAKANAYVEQLQEDDDSEIPF